MFIRRRICGLALLCMGIGSLLAIVFGIWACILAMPMIVVGFWLLFM